VLDEKNSVSIGLNKSKHSVTSTNNREDNTKMVNANRIFQAFIVIVVGLALLPAVRDFVAQGLNGSSTTEAILLGLVTLFWVIGLIAITAVLMGLGGFGRR
jgi:hypothetical protein